MRISTSQIYDSAIRSMQSANSAVLKSLDQISANRRILTPSDDPVASAQVLNVSQSMSVNEQYQTNQKNADSQLRLVDSNLTTVLDVLQNVRASIVQGGSTASLNNTNREALAKQLESDLSEVLGIANTDNGLGEFLFSGYQGGTRPFASDGSAAIAPSTTPPIKYFGDDGDRALQVSASRQMAVTVSGSAVFMDGKNGNGTFATATGGNTSGGINKGTGIVDGGTVLDPQKWQAALGKLLNTPTPTPSLQIRFSVDAAGKSTYQLFDASPATPVAVSDPATFTPGQSISLKMTSVTVPIPAVPPVPSTQLTSTDDFGVQVVVEGQPADGDTFTIKPGTQQSVFQTLQNMIGVLRSPVGATTYTATQYSNDLAGQLATLDQQMANIGEVQAQVGANMKELDSLASNSSDLGIQYTATISKLQDLDYYAAYSTYLKQQMTLEAAQKSFSSISSLSLFKYI